MIANHPRIQFVLMLLLFLPLFFLLDGSIFNDPAFYYSSGNYLITLPLPTAVPVCFLAVFLMIRIDKVRASAGFIFSFFLLMMLAVLLQGGENRLEALELGKFILLIQCLLPAFGLVVGQSYCSCGKSWCRYETAMLCVLVLIVPLELAATWLQGTASLTPYLYAFSIYQHLEYVPVLLVGMFLLTMPFLYGERKYRFLLLLLSPMMGIYAAASMSITAMLLLAAAVICLAAVAFTKRDRGFGIAVMAACLLAMSVYMYTPPSRGHSHSLPAESQTVSVVDSGSPLIVDDHVYNWGIYWHGLWKSATSVLFGHDERLDTGAVPSAQNYFLDMAYNFGLISLVPLMLLLLYSCRQLRHALRHGKLSENTWALAVLVLFLVFVDNAFNVGLRQPYPGILTFFFWGMLLNQLSERVEQDESVESNAAK